MLEAAKNLFLIVSALFPLVDPLGGSPFFLAMTNGYLPNHESTIMAIRSISIAHPIEVPERVRHPLVR